MNAAAHYLLAFAIMALLTGVMFALRRPGAGEDEDATRDFGACCRGSDCHCAPHDDSARDS
jgi:hypothetical protein